MGAAGEVIVLVNILSYGRTIVRGENEMIEG